jgi:site-specific DNA-cytosine methylase
MQNKPNDIRVKLLQDVLLQLITQYPTSWIVFENVENVIRLNCLQTAFQAIHRSRGVLFDEDRAKTYVVNAADLGVPQNRRRLVLPIPPVGYSVPPPLAKTSSPKTFGQVIGKGFKDPDPEHWGMTAAEKIIQDNLDGYCPSNSWDVTPTCVLASKRVFLNSGKYNHPNGARRLSVGENMAIQGLPLVKLAGDMASRYRQVGNAVPPPLSEAIGKQIICHNTKI